MCLNYTGGLPIQIDFSGIPPNKYRLSVYTMICILKRFFFYDGFEEITRQIKKQGISWFYECMNEASSCVIIYPYHGTYFVAQIQCALIEGAW